MNRIPFPPNQSLQAFKQGFYAVGLHACMQSFNRSPLGFGYH
ncbi:MULTISPECIES: hypothetical protein [unclassified Acinetobacter]|nr:MULTISPECIES: hypothetical protein [unclassified Acinetobacter]